MILPVAVGTGSPLHSCTLSGLKWPPARGSQLPCSRHQARSGSHNNGIDMQPECNGPVSSWGQCNRGMAEGCTCKASVAACCC